MTISKTFKSSASNIQTMPCHLVKMCDSERDIWYNIILLDRCAHTVLQLYDFDSVVCRILILLRTTPQTYRASVITLSQG